MTYEAELVKDANWIKLYCHVQGYMDSNLAPIPIEIEIQEVSSETYNDIYVTNFLEYNKITLADKLQQFTIPDSVMAWKIPEHYESLKQELGFAFKAFLPPRLEKIEFIKRESGQEDIVLYTKHFSLYNAENVLVEPDKTYAKWFIYSIAQKLIAIDDSIPEEAYCFEYDLHRVDTNAHAKDIVTLPMQFDCRSAGLKQSVYYDLYTKEIAVSGDAKAQVINGNLITNGYRLFYLGNNIYDGTDEVNQVISWAAGKYNSDEQPIIAPDISAKFVAGSLNAGYINFFSTLEGANIPIISYPELTANFIAGSLNAGYIDFFSNLAEPYIPPEPPSSPNYLSGVMFASDTTIGTNNELVLGDIMGQTEEQQAPVFGTMDEASETLIEIKFGTME